MTTREKRDYLTGLLMLCTDKQRDLYRRMYVAGLPAGSSPEMMVKLTRYEYLDWAINQAENTLNE